MNAAADGYGSSCIMSMNLDGCGKEQLKTQFVTREGVYKLLTLATYSRPNRIGYNVQTNTSVRVSFVGYSSSDTNGNNDRMCFNIGRELYVFYYKGTKKVSRNCAYFVRLMLTGDKKAYGCWSTLTMTSILFFVFFLHYSFARIPKFSSLWLAKAQHLDTS